MKENDAKEEKHVIEEGEMKRRRTRKTVAGGEEKVRGTGEQGGIKRGRGVIEGRGGKIGRIGERRG